MILVEHVTKLSDKAMIGEAWFEKGDLWKDERGVPVAWALEVMAQTCAAYIGCHFQDKGIRGGRLLKVRDMSFKVAFLPYGKKLTAHAKLDAESDLNFFVFTGSLKNEDVELASACLSILAQ